MRTFYEGYGDGEPTVLLLPTWSIIHSRCWKMQIPYLARHCRVVAFDGRGNGRSDRPAEPEAYVEQEFADDALAVMDATGTDRAVLVSLSRGAERSLLLAAGHPERVAGMVFIAPALPLPPAAPRARAEQAVHPAAGVLQRLGEVEQQLLARALRGLPRLLLRAGLHRAALHQAPPFLYFPLAHHFEPSRSDTMSSGAMRGPATTIVRRPGTRAAASGSRTRRPRPSQKRSHKRSTARSTMGPSRPTGPGAPPPE